MHKWITVLLLLVTSTASINVHAQNNAVHAKVHKPIIETFEGISALDLNRIQQQTTPDFLLLENGALWNMDTITTKLNAMKGVSFSRTNKLDFIKTEVNGNTAWVAYNNAASITVNGLQQNVQWLESAFLIKEGEKWKLKMLHSTLLQPHKD